MKPTPSRSKLNKKSLTDQQNIHSQIPTSIQPLLQTASSSLRLIQERNDETKLSLPSHSLPIHVCSESLVFCRYIAAIIFIKVFAFSTPDDDRISQEYGMCC